jgi:hypothetical protein
MTATTDTWHWLSLGDGMGAAMPAAQIEEAFRSLYEAAGRPAEMAVFTRRDEGDLHCEVTAYFAPAASAVAHAFGAQPCPRPPRAGLELAAGDERCWAALFRAGEPGKLEERGEPTV